MVLKNKVCHFTTVHSIDDVRIFTKECTSLANNGFDVTLIACGDIAFEDIKNRVKRISLNVPVKNRLQRFLKRSKAVYKKALEVDADIYHFHDPELIPIGLKLRKGGRIVIYDSHEDTSAVIKTRLWLPRVFSYPISFLFRKYENYAAKRFSAIISVTPLIVEKFRKINTETYQIANYPSFNPEENINNQNRSNIAFAGAITHAYMFENVLQALNKSKGVRLVLAGVPVTSNYFELIKSSRGWSKVDYRGKISHNEVKKIYNKSLIGIACLGYIGNVGFKEGSLGVLKLFEYMNAGMAVICTDFKLWKNIIDKYECGIYVNPNNVEEIRNAIQYLVDNPEKTIVMGSNGRKAIKDEFNWETQEKVLLNLYRKLKV